MKRGLVVCLVCASIVSLAQSRSRGRMRPDLSFYYDYGQMIYAEAVNLSADDRSQSRMLVDFRVAYDALTFQKPTANASVDAPFMAVLLVRADLLDKRDVTVHRASWRDTVRVQSYVETNEKSRFVAGAMSFDAAPDTYTLVLTIEDGVSRQPLRELRPHVRLRDFKKSVVVSEPLFVSRTDSTRLWPLNIGGSAEFGAPFTALVDVAADVQPTVRYTLLRVQGTDTTVYRHGAMSTAPGQRIIPHELRCCGLEPAQAPWRFTSRCDIPGDSLETGEYFLYIVAVAGTDTCRDSTAFRVRWTSMPLSLSETDYSIDAMKYILTDSELDSMRAGNAADRKRHFDDYWKSHDPTPGTVYNERKTEYYRRVDYAFFTFRGTRDDEDGVRSDRGKIYILYGRPTNVDRQLLPDGPAQEKWTYTNNVRKRFTFVDTEKTGVYRLTDVADLK